MTVTKRWILAIMVMASVLLVQIGAQLELDPDDVWIDEEEETTTTKATKATATTKRRIATVTTTTRTPAPNVRALTEQPDYCGLRSETGPCKALIESFFFNVNSKKCEQFIWGGCGGNKNRFPDYATCMDTCGPREGGRTFATYPAEVATTPANLSPECYLTKDAGTGSDMMLRYYFNPKIAACQAFMYSGEGGNWNNFQTVEDCKITCSSNGGADLPRILPATTTTVGVPIAGCDTCTVGRCGDLTITPDNYTLISSYLQIFLGLQAQCQGKIQSFRFIDRTPLAGKQFYVTVWNITGIRSSDVDRVTGRQTVNISDIRLILVKIIPVKANGQAGWQEYNVLSQNIRIAPGQYFGIHMASWMTMNPDCVVPYASLPSPMPSICVRADQASFALIAGKLPQPIPILSASDYQLDMRRPALLIRIKSDDGLEASLGSL